MWVGLLETSSLLNPMRHICSAAAYYGACVKMKEKRSCQKNAATALHPIDASGNLVGYRLQGSGMCGSASFAAWKQAVSGPIT